MSAPGSPAVFANSAEVADRPRWVRGLRRSGSVSDPRDLRVSHDERAAVTDELSRHYSEGRLDDDEFSRRLDQALKAKTYRDLAGLLDDLPSAQAVPPGQSLAAVGPTGYADGDRRASQAGLRRSAGQRARPARRRPAARLLLALAVLVLAGIALTSAARAVAWTLTPVLWIGLLVAIAMVVSRHRPRRW